MLCRRDEQVGVRDKGNNKYKIRIVKETTCICIGRQLASGGRAVGKILAERLGMQYFDREILDLAAKESGLSREIFEQGDEKRGFFASVARAANSILVQGDVYRQPVSAARLFEIQAESIRKAASENDCVFIGRAADYVLRNHPRCLNVFISADETDRIEVLMKDKGLDMLAARHMIEKVDAKRSAFYNFYSGKKWGVASSYDLCLNTSKLGFERCADIIISCLNKEE